MSQPSWPSIQLHPHRIAIASVILLLACIATLATASSGDLAPEYIHCVQSYNTRICQSPSSSLDPLPLSLRLTHWTCLDNCRYQCMQAITAAAIANNSRVLQYHGKWPFVRFLGMQEPASVLFSILNGYMHFRGWLQIRRVVPSYTMRPFYIGYAIIGMNTWLWSAVYHSRDWPSTEKLDYFSAGISVMYGLFYSTIRVTRMERTSRVLWGLACLIPLLMHIGYLGLVHFDYGYNMAATATVGALHNLVWIGWSIKHWNKLPYAHMPALWAALITLAMSLEMLDFPPLFGAVDAHALWHLATIPLVANWYKFLVLDTEWELGRSGHRKPFGSYLE